jgi:hypothetical protein
MKKVEGNFSPWGGEEKAVLIPKSLEKSNLNFTVLWTGTKEKTDKETNKKYEICTVLIRVKENEVSLGKYFVDGTTEGLGKKTDSGLEIYESGLCDIKDGKLVNVRGE